MVVFKAKKNYSIRNDRRVTDGKNQKLNTAY